MPDLTAHDLYELVKGLPEEARPENCYWHPDPDDDAVGHWNECGGIPYWHSSIDDAHAILLHEASVMRWLAETMGSVSISSEFDADGEYVVEYVLPERRVECSSCDGYATGPTLLHALVAAAEGVG